MKKMSAGIFVFNHNNELLICHPTGGSYYKNWSIPKGKIDQGESPIQAALRETYEESNVYLYNDIDNLKDIGIQPYQSLKSNKIIAGFVYKFKEDVPLVLKCYSLIKTKDDRGKSIKNAGLPENDIIKFTDLKRAYPLLHEAQQKLLHKFLSTERKKFKIN